MSARNTLFALTVAGCLGLLPAGADGGVIVTTPPGDGVSGNGQTSAPFNRRGDTNGNRYQQVYSSSFFAAVAPQQLIQSIAFRPKQGAFGTFISGTVTFSDLRVSLSTTPREANINFPGGLNSDLATNVGADAQEVFSGPITFTTDRMLFDNDVEDFDFKINFMNPFFYQPSMGNLLLEVIIPVGVSASSNFTQLDSIIGGVTSFPGKTGMASATDANLSDGISVGSNSNTGLVTQFEVTPVPEPATVAFFTGLAAVGGYRRRRRSVH